MPAYFRRRNSGVIFLFAAVQRLNITRGFRYATSYVNALMSGSRSPFPAALALATQRKHTCELLGRAIRNLDDLQEQVDHLRRAPAAELSVEFSQRQLESLGRILGQGRERLLQRRDELGVVPSSEPPRPVRAVKAKTSAAEPQDSAGLRQVRRFMRSYRACGRFLGNVLKKTHGCADSATAASVALLLHNLEKQLWLLECRPVGTGAALLAVTFFHSC